MITSLYSQTISHEEHEMADQWILGAIGLTLILPTLVETTWVKLMDEYTPNDHDAASQFNDFMASTYVENGSTRFDVDMWNFNFKHLK
ncbi:unnamed protein product [Rotaria sordida]|uniref:Uncharacterized protein n=2 Tax=Rotaria sordida TaxID=392033 RepID=A0A814XS34_9BILA|nr:unnamed protein product [Rotaria sordida]CAF1347389.1 unnamed protein product [Rotaria sordida]